jgi:hypothetical protein
LEYCKCMADARLLSNVQKSDMVLTKTSSPAKALARSTRAHGPFAIGRGNGTRFWMHCDNRIPLHSPNTRYLRRPTLAPAWKAYATAIPAKMESASKRKAAGAAVADGDGRPAKRQKVPVCAAPKCADCIVGGGSEACERRWSRCGWLLDGARRLGSTSSPTLTSVGPSMSPQHHAHRRRCKPVQRRPHGGHDGQAC